MNATSRGRFFFSLTSSGHGASGMRSSLSLRLMMSIAAICTLRHTASSLWFAPTCWEIDGSMSSDQRERVVGATAGGTAP